MVNHCLCFRLGFCFLQSHQLNYLAGKLTGDSGYLSVLWKDCGFLLFTDPVDREFCGNVLILIFFFLLFFFWRVWKSLQRKSKISLNSIKCWTTEKIKKRYLICYFSSAYENATRSSAFQTLSFSFSPPKSTWFRMVYFDHNISHNY